MIMQGAVRVRGASDIIWPGNSGLWVNERRGGRYGCNEKGRDGSWIRGGGGKSKARIASLALCIESGGMREVLEQALLYEQAQS